MWTSVLPDWSDPGVRSARPYNVPATRSDCIQFRYLGCVAQAEAALEAAGKAEKSADQECKRLSNVVGNFQKELRDLQACQGELGHI